MKKWLIGIVLLIGVVIAAKQLSQNDYSSAKQLADAGNYQAFYTEIKEDVAKGDADATNVLMDYFHKAVQDGDIAEAKYYLDQDRSLINKTDKYGARAMDVVLVTDTISVEMVKLLIAYQPKLDYETTMGKNQEKVTFSEKVIFNCSTVPNGVDILNVLLDTGMNPNFISNVKNGHSNYPPLFTSYALNNFLVFERLLKTVTEINPIVVNKKDEYSLVQFMMNEYVRVINEGGAELKHPIDQNVWNVIHSEKYRQLHEKNVKYITAMIGAGLLNKIPESEVKKMFVFYASTGEMDGTKIFIDNGICQKYPRLCLIAANAARINHFNEINQLIIKGK